MRIRCWGSRGSIPVSGEEFNNYGGDTTCMEVRSETKDCIVIDAGSGIRRLGTELIKERVKKIYQLFTHLHLDHTMGFPFFGPAFRSDTTINFFGPPYQGLSFKETLHGIIKPPYFPVDLLTLPAAMTFRDIPKKSFSIGPLKISTIPLNHPNGGFGYRFEENGSIFVFLTDNELLDERPGTLRMPAFIDFCKGADLLIHDAEYDPKEYTQFKGWGHSTYQEVVELAVKANVKRLGLFHINNRRTDKAMDVLVAKARRLFKRHKVQIECAAVGNKFHIEL